MKEIQIGKELTCTTTVKESDLACSVGSGDVAVYATPMMIAWMEHTAAALLKEYLEDGETSVGVMMHTTHDAATPCGNNVIVTAKIMEVNRKKVTFCLIAKDDKDIIGNATHARVVVNKEAFEARAKAK